MEVAVAVFSPLLDVLADVPDPRRSQGQLYKLPYVLLFAILAIVSGCNSYRGIVTFITVHRHRLNAAFSLLQPRWIPGQIDIDLGTQTLEVQALASRVRVESRARRG